MSHADVLVLGGGAAGLMSAITAAQRDREVVVLERSSRVGKKILMSGGGRCNFTNLYCGPDHFLSHNPHFCKSALSRYTQHDFIGLVEKHGIPYHEKTQGQLFCDVSSKDIVAMLLAECDDAGVRIETDCEIGAVIADKGFRVTTNKGEFSCASLVVATGGLSIPKMGASGFGYDLARQFGLNVYETCAALVPFTFTGALHEMMDRLSGVSAAVKVTVTTTPGTVTTTPGTVTSFTDDILFTHRGLSGPAILQISSFWTPGEEIEIDLLPDTDATTLLRVARSNQPSTRLRSVLSTRLPRKLVLELQDLLWPASKDTALAEISNSVLEDIGAQLNAWRIKPAATEGYRTAEVTLGGVDTDELSSKTMECRKVPGLFFAGEVVDVTGHLGGFNFQWAWSSGYAAGLVA